MSTLEVNTINPQSGSTLTLGSSGNTVTLGSGVSGSGFGKIGQVVYTSSTGTVSSASTTFVDTNVSLAITPSSTSSKILFRASVNMFNIGNGVCNAHLRIVRDSTNLIDFDRVLYKEYTAESSQVMIEYLDSPSTTSSTTYKIQTARGNGTETVVVNYGDANGQGITSVTLMEVLA